MQVDQQVGAAKLRYVNGELFAIPVDQGAPDAALVIERVIGSAKCVGDASRQGPPVFLAGEIDVMQGTVQNCIPDRAAHEINTSLAA